MASTATNKQPLLIDRVFHEAIETNSLTSGSDTLLDIQGANQSSPLVNCSANDGAIVEDLYALARSDNAYTVLFFLSSSLDYLRNGEAIYLTQVKIEASKKGEKLEAELPKILAPMPHTGDVSFSTALYIPKGKVLWATLQQLGPDNSPDCPIVAAQGGFY